MGTPQALMAGGGILLVIVLIALLAQRISPHDLNFPGLGLPHPRCSRAPSTCFSTPASAWRSCAAENLHRDRHRSDGEAPAVQGADRGRHP